MAEFPVSRRDALRAGARVAVGLSTALASAPAVSGGEKSSAAAPAGNVVLNDDGHVFLYLNDDLGVPDLRRYLQSYCRPGVGTVAYCVGDMSWPTFYPSKVGVPYTVLGAGGDLKRARAFKNLDTFASEPGGYFGVTFRLLRELGKKVLASFRMNDAHFTSTQNPHVSKFWREHEKFALGPAYGYYGGCLNYAAEAVRSHFFDRLIEFAGLYPDVDGFELDAMRSPYFFPPGKGKEGAPLFSGLLRDIKAALARQAKRLGRPTYQLAINVPLTPELALECGLDVAAWDAERLVDRVSVGTYQASMNHPVERWKKVLPNRTPLFAYVNCSPQTGRYLGLEEYRAAAANAYGAGGDGVYLFNYPCLFELALQLPVGTNTVTTALPDLRAFGQGDYSRVSQALDEIGRAETLRGKDKHFLYYFNNEAGYRHFDPDVAGMTRRDKQGRLKVSFRCYEDYDRARALTLRFKIENVARAEQFGVSINDRPVEAGQLRLRYAANGRDTRMHTVTLGPYLAYEIALKPGQLREGANRLAVTPARLLPQLESKINFVELELVVGYGSV